MATILIGTAKRRIPMDSSRKTSLTAGALYLLTFVSIPTLMLYESVKEANYIIGPGPDTAALVGGLLEVIVALAGIGTAVVLYPVIKRQNERLAMGLVGVRVLEAQLHDFSNPLTHGPSWLAGLLYPDRLPVIQVTPVGVQASGTPVVERHPGWD